MNNFLENIDLNNELSQIAEVANYLWQKNWAECNDGNISINVSKYFSPKDLIDIENGRYELKNHLPLLANNAFYLTGAGKKMRDVAKSPLDNGAIIVISQNGKSYDLISNENITPTSELISHLLIQNNFVCDKHNYRSVLHTHPTELIALSHCNSFTDETILNNTIWSMIPEARIVAKKGVGLVDYLVPGTIELAFATINKLCQYDLVIWQKHGALAIGESIADCFDLIDTVNKSAQIYLTARMANFTPIGLTENELDELEKSYLKG